MAVPESEAASSCLHTYPAKFQATSSLHILLLCSAGPCEIWEEGFGVLLSPVPDLKI